MPIAVYARLSVDDGTKLSTHRQEADCRSYAAVRGWDVGRAYVDRDTSAYQPGVHRPQWEQLLADVAAGRVDGVVVWKLDRLVRRAADFERFWQTAEPAGCFIASVTEPIDTTTDLGMAIVRILVVFAQLESATTSTRVKRAKQQSAVEGRPKHGGHRGFAHNRDGTLHTSEASIVRDAAARVLAGDSLSGIVRDWRHAGIQTPTGGTWHTQHLRRLLMQARLAGARELADGSWVATGLIEPALSEATVRQLRAVLTDPRRRTTRPREHDALLTGLIHCAVCGSRLEIGKVRDRRLYVCRDRPERAGCGQVSVTTPLADQHVAGLVVEALASPAITRARQRRRSSETQTAAIARRVVDLRASLERLAVDHYTGRRLLAEYEAARAAVLAELGTAEAALARVDDLGVLDQVATQDAAAAWHAHALDWQRRVTRLVVSRVDCMPAERPRNVWRPERLRVALRDGVVE